MTDVRARSATFVAVATAVLTGWITLLAPAAFAQPVPPDGPPFGPAPQSPPVAPVRVIEVGSPVWQFALVAVAAAAVAIVVQRLIVGRPQSTVPASNAA